MKKNLIAVVVLLFCLFVQFETNFAQMPAAAAAPVDLGNLNGKAKTLAKPVYPPEAVKAKIGGAVKVNITVDEQGNVVKAEAVSGDALLRNAAVTAAKASKFSPKLVNGKAVEMSGFLVFNFAASDSGSTSSPMSEADYKKMFDEYFKADKIDFSEASELFNEIQNSKNKSQNKPEDSSNFKKNPISTPGQLNKVNESQNPSKDSQSAAESQNRNECMSEMQFETFEYKYKNSEWKPVSVDTLKNYIKLCDEAVKIDSDQALPYYNRGMSRYYLIRGFNKPIIKTLSDTENVSDEDLHLSLADLQVFIRKQIEFNNKRKDGLAAEELQVAYIAAGELTAVSGVKSDNAELLHSAIDLWNTGEKLKTLSDEGDKQKNIVFAADRDIVNQIFAEASKEATAAI